MGTDVGDKSSYEMSLIEAFQALADNHSQYSINEPQLLIGSVVKLTQAVLEKCSISLSYGENSPIPKIASLLVTIGENSFGGAIEDLQNVTL